MSNPSALSSIEYEAESTFGEDVTSFATHRIPIIGPLDLSSLSHDKLPPERAIQYRNEITQPVLMCMGGSVKTKIDLAGHGATTMTGSPTVDAIETWLALVFGNVANAPTATTSSSGSATALTTASSGAFTAGALCRVGVLGDGKGNGQMFPIATCVTTTLTLLAAMDAAASAADAVGGCYTLYGNETPTSASVSGVRFRGLTANLRYEIHGCYPTALSFTGLNTGQRPQLEITWAVSWWRYSTGTFPSAVTSNQYNPAPVAAGSFFINDFGTATRAKRTIRDFSLDFTFGVTALEGPGGVSAYQKCIGARRLPDDIKISWTEDADTATTSPVLPGYATATTYKHVMYTLSPTAGSAVGFYFPRVAITAVPIQMSDNGINRLKITGQCGTSTTTTSDLTMSAFRMGLG